MAEFETTFADLGLKAPILESLNDLGYEKPSPIQAECIPHLLAGDCNFFHSLFKESAAYISRVA